ncbi:chaplin [Streptomyces sp. GS7]|uniref:chaplin n=1 Tax=Streptomyces sp. GS7 TaxID=2692234 RepID=UPI0013195C3F|nr:chaplin [Streptomyces sp. GS7]QHC22652.1 DUF320 domain-containing protein [Streptomyces sp. GS7]
MSARTVLATGALIAAALLAGAGTAAADDDTGSFAVGGVAFSPGVGSGNQAQVPIHVPVNVTGDSVHVIGALNPTFGNSSSNG